MVETISSSKVKAIKEHICQWCGGTIKKGEYYEYSKLKYDGDLYTWKNHIKCRDLCAELNMGDDGEGIDKDKFLENVDEFLYENMQEDEWEEYDLGGEDSVDKAIEILKEKNKRLEGENGK